VEAIVLSPELEESLQHDAALEARSVNELVNEAVARYLRDRQREKIARETAAFERLHPRLRRDHPGRWVAIHDGVLVDHDADVSALVSRVRAAFGRTSVLIRQVRDEPTGEIRWRTPSTGRPPA
jgi:hypothetical protein